MEEAAEPETDYTTGTPWLYVDLEGNVTEETEADLKDNFALQQFDEFLDFYRIEEGDGMYLAPEDRVNIW